MSEEILRKRAALLAARRAVAAPATPPIPVLLFDLGKERYAIGLADIQEVVALANPTSVPGAPREILGVMNIRGEIRAIWDLRFLLGLPPREGSPAGHVLLVKNATGEVGFLVDHAEGRWELSREIPLSPREKDGGPASRYLKGVSPDKIIVLDVPALLARVFSGDENQLEESTWKT